MLIKRMGEGGTGADGVLGSSRQRSEKAEPPGIQGVVSKWVPSSAGGNPGELGVQRWERAVAGVGGLAFYLDPLASESLCTLTIGCTFPPRALKGLKLL